MKKLKKIWISILTEGYKVTAIFDILEARPIGPDEAEDWVIRGEQKDEYACADKTALDTKLGELLA